MESDNLLDMLSARNRSGENFFHEACRANSVGLLHRAATWMEEQDPETLNEKTYNGEQCTHIIAKCKTPDATNMMGIVVSLGADINGREGHDGFTPLHLCVLEKNYHLAEWICRELDVDLEATSYGRQTAYHLAYERCDKKMMKILKHAGATCKPPEVKYSSSSEDESDDEREVKRDDDSDSLYTKTLSDLSSHVKKLNF